MTWKHLQNQGRVEPHVTSKAELDDLRAAIKRNVDDAAIEVLSADNRFSIAYQAALLAAKMAVTCAGYRVKGQGAHQTTFQALTLAMGPSFNATATYLDRCRRKRNDLVYDSQGVVSEVDAAELLKQARALHKRIEAWIAKHHSKLT
ncbi:MAG: hypothetical protein AB7O59_18485 [Pirellulales bacterium]